MLFRSLEQFYNEDEEEEEVMPMRIAPTQVNAPVIISPQPLWVQRLQDDLTEVFPHQTRSSRSYSLIHQEDPTHYCYTAADD